MRALVVYESLWGNTRQVAEAIAAGLAESLEVEVHDVEHAPARPGLGVALVVAGGPTHAFSMTRSSTRADAANQGAPHPTRVGLREWLEALAEGRHLQSVATFDTRVEMMRHLPGSAAKSAAKVAHRHGFPRARHVESFYVRDTEGPLVEGELDRARRWGREVAADLRAMGR